MRTKFWRERWSVWGETAPLEISSLATLWGDTGPLDAGEDAAKWLKQHWREWTNLAHGIFVGEDFNALLLKVLPSVPKKIVDIQKVDVLARDERRKWWPECRLRDSLHELVIGRTPHLDCSQMAYVTGLGLEMRVAMAVVAQLGFPTINLVVMDLVEGEKALAELQRKYFSVKINLLENADLTMQKNNGSLLINTARDEQTSDLIRDLSYLNFVLADGLVVDMNVLPLKNQMIEEARNVGLPVLLGWEILGYRDYLLLKQMIPSMKIDFSTYKTDWLAFLEALEGAQPQASP
jgi:hypothetical protein